MAHDGDHPDTERILRVLVYIQHNLDTTLSIEQLARVACYSPFHFHRVFRGMVGEPVVQHVRRLRLERAAQRLKYTDRPVVAIAFEAGYESHEAFTRAFGSAFGCPPSRFRADASVPTEIDAPAGVHFVSASKRLSFTPVQELGATVRVEVRTIEPTHVAFVRHTGPYDQVGRAWDHLMEWCGRRALFTPDTRLFGACWDDPDVTPHDKIRYDACVTVPPTVSPSGSIGAQTLAGGVYAAVLHEGPYARLGATYAALLGRWFPANHHEPADPPSLEFYLNDPNSTEQDDLLTEICMPIKA